MRRIPLCSGFLGLCLLVSLAGSARAQQFVNGSFETGDYFGWTLFETPTEFSSTFINGTLSIALDGQPIPAGASLFDYFYQEYEDEISPGLPHTYTATDGSYVALMLQSDAQIQRFYQDVALPATATTVSWDMEYHDWKPFPFFDPAEQQLQITVRNPANDAILATLFTTTPGGSPQSIPTMTHFTGDVSAFAGQTVRISVEMLVTFFPFDAAFDNFRVNTGNALPTVAADLGSVTVNEGQTASNTGTYSDANPGDNVTITASVGMVTKTGTNSGTWSWSYGTSDGPAQNQTVTITANDGHPGGVGTTTFELNVNNVAPSATLNAPASVNEGSSINVSLTSPSDPSSVDTAAGFTYAFDQGDGAGYGPFGPGNSVSIPTTDNGSRTVKAKIRDKDLDAREYTATVTINNVAPLVTPAAGQSANESSATVFALGSFTDPGADSPWAVDVNWGDGSPHSMFNVAVTGSLGTRTHTYADNGSYTVTVKVTDKDGAWHTASFSVTVNNVAPAVTPPAANPSPDEGSAASFSLGSFSDPGAGDGPWAVDVDWGDGSAHSTFNAATPGSLGTRSHTYADSGVYTVTVSVQDKDGGTGSANFNVAVNNVTPQVTPAAGQSADEGSATAFALGSFSDPGADSPWAVDVNWGDGSLHSMFNVAAAGSLGTRTHTYADNGTYTVTVKVTDKDGAWHSASFSVTVNNVAPAVTPPAANPSSDEGSAGSFSLGSFSDPGAGDGPWAVDVDWGDGSTHSMFNAATPGSLGARSHTYADNGSYTVTVKVKDKDGDAGSATFTVAVNNVAPSATLNAPASVNEGGSINVSLTSPSDPSSVDTAAGFTYAFDQGDGAGYGPFGPGNSVSIPTTDNGSRTVKAKIRDKDGGEREYTATVTINNVAPTVTPAAGQSADEGSATTFTLGSFSDPGADSPWAVDVDWGDGSPHSMFNVMVTGSLGTRTHTYADNGTYTVAVKVTDKDGASDSESFSVTVNNVAPAVTPPATNPSPDEGSAASFSLGSFSDPGAGDGPWAVDVDWGDGSAHSTFNAATPGSLGSQSHTYADSGSFTVKVKVKDKDGGTGSATFTVTVNNVAPTATITGPASGYLASIYTAVQFRGSFTDPGVPDTHTATWSFVSANASASAAGNVTESNGSGSVSNDYSFVIPGVYAVTLSVEDKDHGIGTATTVNGVAELPAFVVIYDPNGAFVTGGGWINSPAGAMPGAPSAAGKATFGFEARYKPGANAPSGNTEFQFRAGNLSFKSTSYEWLVVSGARAQFKGVGTVNGAAGYNFILTAIDGQVNGGGGVDKFRMKISDAKGKIVYDNQIGTNDNGDLAASTALGGGSIVIHK